MRSKDLLHEILRGGLVGLQIFFAMSIVGYGQTGSAGSVIVKPGAPGQPSRILPSTTKASPPRVTQIDIKFMQDMIVHHAQAVEMTAMIEERTSNKSIRLIGARISQSQSDEMEFMKHWLELRGQPIAPKNVESEHTGHHSGHGDHSLMSGMLTPKQMDELRKAKGSQFDELFLNGMIQHHAGALTMVKELFESSGSGQDAQLFTFATDVDNGQRAEIKIMQTLLRSKP